MFADRGDRNAVMEEGARAHGDGSRSPASFLDIPERSVKPRERGLTHVIDRGLSVAEVDGLLEVAGESGRSVMVPFTRAVVPVVDLAGGKVVIDPPEGLFDNKPVEVGAEEE